MECLCIRNQTLSKTCPFLRHSGVFSTLLSLTSFSYCFTSFRSQAYVIKIKDFVELNIPMLVGAPVMTLTQLSSMLFKHLLVWALKFNFKNNILINSLTIFYNIYDKIIIAPNPSSFGIHPYLSNLEFFCSFPSSCSSGQVCIAQLQLGVGPSWCGWTTRGSLKEITCPVAPQLFIWVLAYLPCSMQGFYVDFACTGSYALCHSHWKITWETSLLCLFCFVVVFFSVALDPILELAL